MFKTSCAAVTPDRLQGRRTWRLLDHARGGAEVGALALIELSGGAHIEPHRHPSAEQAVVVLEGEGVIATAAGDARATAGTVMFAPRGAWHAVRPRGPMRLLIAHGGTSGAIECEPAADGTQAGEPVAVVVDSDEIAYRDAHDPRLGFHHLSARWLVDGAGLGSHTLVVGQSWYATPDAAHDLHRHPHASEFLYLVEGEGIHVTGDRDEVALSAGDVTLVAPGEWHGFRVRGDHQARALFGFFGVSSRDAAGYEVHPKLGA
jgi:quercetin dioxygenase-like cupin family protein